MRKVLFQKWIEGVETIGFSTWKETHGIYDSYYGKHYEDGTHIFSDFIHEGFFHEFAEVEQGHKMAMIEHESIIVYVETSNFKFIDCSESHDTDWNKVRIDAAIGAMNGMLSDYDDFGDYSRIASNAVMFSDALVAELQKTKR